MNFKIKQYSFTSLTFFLVQIIFAQKTFHVSIQFPISLESKKIQIKYENGKKEILVIDSIRKNKITFSGKFYSKFATIKITYPKTKTSFYYNEYFVQNRPSLLIFSENKKDSLSNPFDNSKLVDAIEIKKTIEAKKLKDYTLLELNDLEKFYAKYEKEINTIDSMTELANIKSTILAEKELEFVKENANTYFSFWIFRTRLINEFIDTNPSLLLETFTSLFPKKIRESIEGKEAVKEITGRLFTKKNYPAPNFKTKDIFGKLISLKNYSGKYILLNFWATWCGPCLEKVPFINALRRTYSKEDLEIIGVNCDTDTIAFSNCIEKNKMNWTHIFGDSDLNKAYGNRPLPSLYLINKKGIIIYSNWEDNNDKLVTLLKTSISNK